ncbi:unnamed protein product [Diabrotica balteata]|uniref:Uncharacterized protein n=1 Tax=Diabrotica balteata TaxID=107213 RepID=A0A9N9T018_DIABA|nr:unnamed protein product [Diabrotica balteata]
MSTRGEKMVKMVLNKHQNAWIQTESESDSDPFENLSDEDPEYIPSKDSDNSDGDESMYLNKEVSSDIETDNYESEKEIVSTRGEPNPRGITKPPNGAKTRFGPKPRRGPKTRDRPKIQRGYRSQGSITTNRTVEEAEYIPAVENNMQDNEDIDEVNQEQMLGYGHLHGQQILEENNMIEMIVEDSIGYNFHNNMPVDIVLAERTEHNQIVSNEEEHTCLRYLVCEVCANIIYLKEKARIYECSIQNLEDLSSTDTTQQWGKLKKENMVYEKPTPINGFCHMGKTYTQAALESRLDSNAEGSVLDILLSGAEGSELQLSLSNSETSNLVEVSQTNLLQLAMYHDIFSNNKLLPMFDKIMSCTIELSDNLVHFYNKEIFVNHENSINLCRATISQSGEVWRNARRMRITGTTCYNVYTYCKNKNPNWVLKSHYLTLTLRVTLQLVMEKNLKEKL